MNTLKQIIKGKAQMTENVTYRLTDKDGKVKKLFQPNKLTQFLLKKGILSPYMPKLSIFGSWEDQMVLSNLVVDAGLAGVASRINGAGSEAAFTYIGLGSGTTSPVAGNTALQTEISTNGGARANATASRITTNSTNDTARLLHQFDFSGSLSIAESGVLNAGSGGTLLARQTFTAIPVVNGDGLQVTWDFVVDTP